ncbi:MAG: NAD-dependent DNA ligase LigA, partial [Candidatus Omnitrophica bacterium]|nr:NAD-dependent DNA ligase LigA [Candidatus Omnitrophota bacterium]
DRLGIRIGDWVVIQRAGEVIPQVVKVIESKRTGKERPVRPPSRCPACHGVITKERAEEVAERCINPSCPSQLARSVLHFGSRHAMDIEGLGDIVVEQLVSQGVIHNVAEIYRLTEGDLLKLPLFAERKAQKLLETIQASRTRGLARLLYGLGIRHVGEKAARGLAERFGSMTRLMQVDQGTLEQVPGIGPVVAEAVVQFFHQPETRQLIKELGAAGVRMTEAVRSGPHPLLHATFVFTGELSSMSRNEAEALVRKLGGAASSSVSRKTTYVVAGDAPGSKLEQAKRLGVAIIDEAGFQQLIRKKGSQSSGSQ